MDARERALLGPSSHFEGKVERQFMCAGIRMRHPGYDEEQVEMALARLLWGDELYRKARPQWPLLEP